MTLFYAAHRQHEEFTIRCTFTLQIHPLLTRLHSLLTQNLCANSHDEQACAFPMHTHWHQMPTTAVPYTPLHASLAV